MKSSRQRYDEARQALANIREEIEAFTGRILAAAEAEHPGIAQQYDALLKKEQVLQNLAIQAAVESSSI
jgi:hypothetical protein